jgi:hypothetical protein
MFRDLTRLLTLRVSQGSGWQTFLTALAVSRLTIVTNLCRVALYKYEKAEVLIMSYNIYIQYRNRVVSIATKLGDGQRGFDYR